MSHKRYRDRIPSEELTAYERWELPLLDEQGNEVPRSHDEDRNVKPLTAADLAAIREEAREDGLKEGREAGHKEGYEAGFSEGREAGHQQGLEEGREQGRTEALEQTSEEVEQKLQRLEEVMASLLDPIQRHEDETEAALVNLTSALARAVVFRELQLDSSQIQKVVNRALAALPSTRENVTIRVHPDDADWVREVSGRFEVDHIVREDETIMPGGCLVNTSHSLIDFTVEKRFQKAVQGMLDRQLSSDDPGDSADLDAMMDDLTDLHRDVLESTDSSPSTPTGEEGDEHQPG